MVPLQKGRDGCRVHLWGNFSDYSYSRASQNVYLYPVGIGPTSGPGVFSFDDFVGLLGHEVRPSVLRRPSVRCLCPCSVCDGANPFCFSTRASTW